MSRVASSAALSRSAVSVGSRSSAPTGWIRQRPASASDSTAPSMIFSSPVSCSGGRLVRLSLESSHSVTTSTPTSSHQPSSGRMLSAPAW